MTDRRLNVVKNLKPKELYEILDIVISMAQKDTEHNTLIDIIEENVVYFLLGLIFLVFISGLIASHAP